MGEMVVGNRDPCGTHHHVDQAVLAVRERAVIDPDVSGAEDGDPVAVRFGAPPVVRGAGPDVGLARLVAVVDVDVVDYDVAYVL